MKEYVANNCKPTTITNYEKKIRLHIKPAIGKYRLAALMPEAVQKLINDKFNAGYSRNTLAVFKGILTGSLSYAVQPLKYIQVSPAQYVDIPSTRAIPAVKSRSAPHVYLSPEQMAKIFERFPEGTASYLPLLLGYKCGLRISETFALEWSDIDFQEKKMTVRQQILWQEKDRETGTAGFWYFTCRNMTAFGLLNSLRTWCPHWRGKRSAKKRTAHSMMIFAFISFGMRRSVSTQRGGAKRSAWSW